MLWKDWHIEKEIVLSSLVSSGRTPKHLLLGGKRKKKKGQKESWEKNKAKPRRELLALGLPLPSSTHISVLIGGH